MVKRPLPQISLAVAHVHSAAVKYNEMVSKLVGFTNIHDAACIKPGENGYEQWFAIDLEKHLKGALEV